MAKPSTKANGASKQDEAPPHVDQAVLTVSLTHTRVTALRRTYAGPEKKTELLFAVVPDGVGINQAPLMNFNNVLELKEALGFLVENVVSQSVVNHAKTTEEAKPTQRAATKRKTKTTPKRKPRTTSKSRSKRA